MDLCATKPALALALCALCALSIASAQPFPCEPVDPCEDDPSFLIFGLFPCTASPVDPCALSDGVTACAQACASCAICEEPEIFMSLSATLQFAEIAPGVLSAFVNSAITIAGYQGQVACEAGGKCSFRVVHAIIFGQKCLILLLIFSFIFRDSIFPCI